MFEAPEAPPRLLHMPQLKTLRTHKTYLSEHAGLPRRCSMSCLFEDLADAPGRCLRTQPTPKASRVVSKLSCDLRGARWKCVIGEPPLIIGHWVFVLNVGSIKSARSCYSDREIGNWLAGLCHLASRYTVCDVSSIDLPTNDRDAVRSRDEAIQAAFAAEMKMRHRDKDIPKLRFLTMKEYLQTEEWEGNFEWAEVKPWLEAE